MICKKVSFIYIAKNPINKENPQKLQNEEAPGTHCDKQKLK